MKLLQKIKQKHTKNQKTNQSYTKSKTTPIPKKVSPLAFTLLKKNGVYTEVSHTEPEKINIFSPSDIFKFLFHAKQQSKRLYVIMHKENGFIALFYVYYKGNIFIYDERIYIVDDDKLRWNDMLKTYVGEYYESISLPIQLQKFKQPMKQQLHDGLAESQIQMNINSKILYETVKSEMVQKVMKGEELEKFMEFIKRLLFFVLAGVILTLVSIAGRFF